MATVTLSLDDEPLAVMLPSRQEGPESAALRGEVREEVQRAVDRLAPAYRIPLILRYWHDLSYQEIADIMGLTVQAVKSRLHRARLQMIEEVPHAAVMALIPAAVR